MASNMKGSVAVLSDSEIRASFSLLPHVLKLNKALLSGSDGQTIHAIVRGR